MKLVDLRRSQERKAVAAARAAQNLDLQTQILNSASPDEGESDPTTGEPVSTGTSLKRAAANRAKGADARPEAATESTDPSRGASDSATVLRAVRNRANAQFSTGPTSTEGKSRSSRNAVTTALTGRTVLLPSDDLALYQQHLESFFERFGPVGAEETVLVQSLADIAWRLDRIAGLEMAIFAAGEIRFAEQFGQHPAPIRRRLIELEVYVAEERRLRNLQIQEGRLCRRRELETAQLRQLQQQRRSCEAAELDRAAHLFQAALDAEQYFDPAAHGFEFSLPEIEHRRAQIQAQKEEREAFFG